MSFKLRLHEYCSNGFVTDIKEEETKGLIKSKILSFKFYDKEENCNGTISFETSDPKVDLYESACRFVSRLKYANINI